jgi:hypothetical protein
MRGDHGRRVRAYRAGVFAVSSRACTIAALGVALFGCGGGEANGPSAPPIPPLSYLSLFPAQGVSVVGDTIMFVVTARDLAGADVPDIAPLYASSSPGVVSIQPDGRIVASGVGTATVRANGGGQTAEATIHVGSATYDLAGLGPPRVLDAGYIDLSKIERVSRFRSAIGHSYVDGSGETCRSMKHYFQPKASVDWTAVEVYAPATGTIWKIATDGWGYRVMLRPRDLPALNIAIFHVNPDPGIVKDTWVNAGDRIGRHASSSTMSDIATDIGGKENGTLLSYFQTMTDGVFALYQARGVASREAAIITKEERDADPVPCVGEQQFPEQGTLPNWVDLN